jgi:hypothetical protein
VTRSEESKARDREYQRGYKRRKEAQRAAAAAAGAGGEGAAPPAELTGSKVTRAISRYLDSVRIRDESGRKPRRSNVVTLGALPGFPQSTADPEVIDRAIEKLVGRISETGSAVAELELRQRIRDLRAAVARVREGAPGPDEQDRSIFIAHAAAWAASRKAPISYEAFREMGVPADVLRDAAIPRRPTV